MGTKVQCKSYFQEHCSMRDLNEDAESGNWPLYYGDQMLKSRQYYNGFLPRPSTDGHLDAEKEMLKQTMLKHESIFRNQVFELHRLYRIQRDLMEDLKKKEAHKYAVPVEASKSEYFSSQMPSEHAQKASHISSVSFGKSVCSRPSVSATENRQSPMSFVKESSMQVESVPTQNGSFKDCKFPEFNSVKKPRRMFDLQLPAEEYIDSEGEQLEEDKVSQASGAASYPPHRGAPDSVVKLSIGNGGNKYRGEASSPNSRLWNKHSVADLNQPIQVEEASSSAPSNNILGPIPCNEETQGHYLPVKQNSGSSDFHREFFHRVPADNRFDINALHSEDVGSRIGCQSNNLDIGQSRCQLNAFSQGFGPDEFRTTSRPLQAEFKSTQLPAFLLGDRSKREPWKEGAVYGAEISNRSQSFSNHNFSRSIEVPLIHSPIPGVPDFADCGSSYFSPWRKPTSSSSQNQIAVQALPCFNNSPQFSNCSRRPIQNHGFMESQWHLNNSHPKSNSSFISEVPNRNGFFHGPQLDPSTAQVRLPATGFGYSNCRNDNTSTSEHFENHSTSKYFKGSNCIDVKSARDINLNIAIPNGVVEGRAHQRDLVIIDGEEKNEDAVGGLPWLSKISACNNGLGKASEASNEVGFSHMKAYSQKSAPSPSFTLDTASTSCARVAEEQRMQISDYLSSKKILGFPIFDKPYISKDLSSCSFSSKVHLNHSEVEATRNSERVLLDIDLSRPAMPDSDEMQSTENTIVKEESYKEVSHFKNHFNLNTCAEEEEVLTCSSLGVRVNIDLEAPVDPETAEDVLPQEEFQGDQLNRPGQSSHVQEPSEELVRIVAEAIVSFSSSVKQQPVEVACHPLETPQSDSLYWFAEVVSLHSNVLDGREHGVTLRGKGSIDSDVCDSDGSDYFEMMTLRLTETKMDEYWCKPWEPDSQKEEEVAATIPTRRRRGQARRGRQRRDFQRDILPGLTSLSRHEVTADIQTLGGLMKATGHAWESGLARRNGGRNGWARGRRRQRNPAPTVAVTVACSPPRQQVNTSEMGLEERSLKGWGKTTRRPRRQRLAAGNAPL